MTEQKAPPQLRLRVFAGPNGSGKSTVIKMIRDTIVDDDRTKLDVGSYINADDIAKALTNNIFSFADYEISCGNDDVLKFAEASGLLFDNFSLEKLSSAFDINNNKLELLDKQSLDRVAQIIARYLRKALLTAEKRFSFETVFSHESNLDIMREAVQAGYKVYLYFVSTESPEINKFRVALRVKEGGHDVPADRIEKRYYRSLELLYEAAEIAYQAFFFDNSIDFEPFKLVGHFKKSGDKKIWDTVDNGKVSAWFRKYYLSVAAHKGDDVPEVYKANGA